MKNSGNAKSVWKKVEDHLIKWIVGVAGTAIVIAVAFYFNTNHVMAQNGKDIIDIKKQQDTQSRDIKKIKDDLSDLKMTPVVNQEQIKSIKKDVSKIEKNQDDMDKKIDKILELLLSKN